MLFQSISMYQRLKTDLISFSFTILVQLDHRHNSHYFPREPYSTVAVMAFRTGYPCLWTLILLLCSICVTCIRINPDYNNSPKTYWVDQSCISKGFTPITAGESVHMANRGARRLLNELDDYQGWVFELLFKRQRDFSLSDDSETRAWNVVGKQSPVLRFEYI